MASKTATLVNADHILLGKIGHGLMRMTWIAEPVSDEQAFESIKAGIDTLPPNTKMLLNSAEFYGIKPRTANLELLARFFTKYPELADKTFLAVKGAVHAEHPFPVCTPENIRASVETVNRLLGGTKKLDLFQCARVDPNVPIETSIGAISELVKEGQVSYIGVSETTAATLRRAHAVHPIAAVEIEVSPWEYEERTQDVIATAKELGTVVLAYSPLGRGFLTGEIKTIDDMPENDPRRHFPRFQPDNMAKNIHLVEALEKIAQRKGVTPAQLSIAWVSALGPHVVPIPGSSHKKRTLENLAAADIVLTAEEQKEINDLLASMEIVGHRYMEQAQGHLWG